MILKVKVIKPDIQFLCGRVGRMRDMTKKYKYGAIILPLIFIGLLFSIHGIRILGRIVHDFPIEIMSLEAIREIPFLDFSCFMIFGGAILMSIGIVVFIYAIEKAKK